VLCTTAVQPVIVLEPGSFRIQPSRYILKFWYEMRQGKQKAFETERLLTATTPREDRNNDFFFGCENLPEL